MATIRSHAVRAIEMMARREVRQTAVMSMGRYTIYVVIAAIVLSAAMPTLNGIYDVFARTIVFAVPPILLAAFMPKEKRSDLSAYWLPTFVMIIFVLALGTAQLRDLGYLHV